MPGRGVTGRTVLALAVLLAGPALAATPLRVSTETYGPVALGDQPDRIVTVEATYEEVVAAPTAVWRRTVTRLRFRDQGGRLLSQETLETRFVSGQGFDEENSVGPALELRGKTRRFLLLAQHFEPSAPSGGTNFLVYGFDRQGRFRRLGSPIQGSGKVIRNPTDASGKVILLREGRYLDVSQWTGNFDLILPQEFKEEQEQFMTAALCGKVEVMPETPPEGMVTLYRGPGPRYPTKAVKVTPASKIQFLEGCVGYSRANPDQYTPWIRVRIDGEEGWVPTEEASKVGLPDVG